MAPRKPRLRGRTALTGACALFALGLYGAAAPIAAAGSPSASTQVKDNWQKFFNGTTPAASKVKLLQDGSAFADIIKGQAASGMAKSTTAKVFSVKVVSSSKATVKYTIYLEGKPALANQKGTSVRQSGTWKVGDASFCSLLALEGTKTPACKS